MEKKKSQTESQLKALDEGADTLTAAFEQVVARLAAAGLDFPPDDFGEGSFRCRRCSVCPGFKRPRVPAVKCASSGCGHSFGEHFVI
jgi:hypothetical protein